jgi:hypothetical protein
MNSFENMPISFDIPVCPQVTTQEDLMKFNTGGALLKSVAQFSFNNTAQQWTLI